MKSKTNSRELDISRRVDCSKECKRFSVSTAERGLSWNKYQLVTTESSLVVSWSRNTFELRRRDTKWGPVVVRGMRLSRREVLGLWWDRTQGFGVNRGIEEIGWESRNLFEDYVDGKLEVYRNGMYTRCMTVGSFSSTISKMTWCVRGRGMDWSVNTFLGSKGHTYQLCLVISHSTLYFDIVMYHPTWRKRVKSGT